VPTLSAEDQVEQGVDASVRWSVANIGTGAPDAIEFTLQLSGSKSVSFGGIRQTRTRFGSNCEVVSEVRPIIVQCRFDGRYLRSGNRIRVDVYFRAQQSPQTITVRTLGYRYRATDSDDWITPQADRPAEARVEVVER